MARRKRVVRQLNVWVSADLIDQLGEVVAVLGSSKAEQVTLALTQYFAHLPARTRQAIEAMRRARGGGKTPDVTESGGRRGRKT
jgi:hypothetical protein